MRKIIVSILIVLIASTSSLTLAQPQQGPGRKTDQQRYEEQKRDEEQKRAEDKKRRDDQKRFEEQKRKDDQRRLDEQKRRDEQQRFEEQKRKDDQRRIDEQKRREERQRYEEQRRREDQQRYEEQKRREEQQRREYQKRKEDQQRYYEQQRQKRYNWSSNPIYNDSDWFRINRETDHRSPFSWHDSRRSILDRYKYPGYRIEPIYDRDWDSRFPGLRSYRWHDDGAYGKGYWYKGRRIHDSVLFFDDFDELVGVGFMYNNRFIIIRDTDDYYEYNNPLIRFILLMLLIN